LKTTSKQETIEKKIKRMMFARERWGQKNQKAQV